MKHIVRILVFITTMLAMAGMVNGQTVIPTGSTTQATIQKGGYGADLLMLIPTDTNINVFPSARKNGRIASKDGVLYTFDSTQNMWVAPAGGGGGSYGAGYGLNLNGSTFKVDSSKIATLFAVYDTAHTLRGYINGLFTSYYTSAQVDALLGNYYTKTQSDARYPKYSDTTTLIATEAERKIDILQVVAHITNTSNPHSVTFDQAAKQNPVTDTSVFIGWQDPGGILSVFGNSISADIYTNPPPVPYYAYLAYRHGQTVKVHAHGGATYYRGYTPHNNNGGLMDSVAKLEVMPTPNSKLIIELGFNDGCQYATSYDTTQIKLSLDSFVAQADIKGWLRGSIGALSAWYIPNPALCSSMTDNDLVIINTAIRNECARLGIHYIDLHTIFANNQKRNLYFTDNVHWSSLGHYIGADEIDREMYPQVYVKGNMRVDGVLYDNKGHQVLSIDTTGRKVIEGETGFDVLPDGKALVTVPFTKNYAGMRASGVTFQGLSTYNYFIGFNLHHNGTTYVTDTPGYSGMIQFADGEISYWQSSGSNTAGAAPTLEKRYKFSSNSRGFGFGGNPGNGGRDDFSGSAMQGDASKLQINFPTKIKYAPDNTDGQIQLLIRHINDSFIQVVTSLPYSFIANRLKYANGNNYTLPVFTGADTLINSHIQDSAGHIGIDTVASPKARFVIPISDSIASAIIGALYFQSISASNQQISNNAVYTKTIGTVAQANGYNMTLGLYNFPAHGGSFTVSATPTSQTAGQVLTGNYPYLRVTNWGTVALGYQNSTSERDTFPAALIITHPTSPNSADSVFLPNTAPLGNGNSKVFMVLDNSGARGNIPNKKVAYLSTIPVADVTGAVDTIYRKPGTDSVMIRRNGVVSFAYKDSLSSSASVAWGSITGTISSQTDLQTALNGKAATSHTHAESDIINLTTDLAGKAALSHTHGMSDLTGFNITTPSDGQLVKYDFASGKWVNFTPGYLTSVADATTSSKGIASFSSTNFSVTSGAVSIKTGGVGSTEIADASVALADMANMATGNLIGRNTAGTGAPEVLSIATIKTMLAYTKADIGLTNVENTALSTWTGSSNIATVGTIGTGTWQGSTINSTYLDKSITINAQTGTTYTLQASDLGKIVQCTNASAITVTLPSGLGASFWCIIKQGGAGAVTLAASGTTIHNRQSYTKTAGQYASFIILPESTSNNYSTQGDMQ